MVEPVFSKANIDAMRPHIQKTVDDLLDRLFQASRDQPVDLVANFALPVPSYVRTNLSRDENQVSLTLITASRSYMGSSECPSMTLNT
jgi:hypothetical protein